jgi:hypothetical protein
MEEIIGLLVVLAIGIFKAVGKKLENAGNQPAKTFEPIEENPIPEPQAFDSHRRTVEPTPVAPKPVMPKPAAPRFQPSTIEVVTRQTAPKKPILQEEEQEGPKEKIDPKKLVLYSEIMKQKFNE